MAKVNTRKRTAEVAAVGDNDNQDIKPPQKRNKKITVTKTVVSEQVAIEKVDSIITSTTKRQTRKVVVKDSKTDAGVMSAGVAVRSIASKIIAGAHVSGAGGVHNAIPNALRIGGNAFAVFLKSQRQWSFKPLEELHKLQFIDACKSHKYAATPASKQVAPIVPHGSYLVNLAHTDKARADQAYTTFLDDLVRCHQLGIDLYNFHPGNAIGASSRDEALRQLAGQLNRAHRDKSTGQVVTLLETMAATGGNTIGSTFEELAAIIALVDDKTRVGVCLDTCHVFAAGYDLRSADAFRATLDALDATVGLGYLRALHVNDSKAPLRSGRDLHACLGTGFLGLRAFWNLVNEPRLWGLPFILETPDELEWPVEIKLLEDMVGMDPESDHFKTLEINLAGKGKAERDRVQAQVDKRDVKGKKTTKKQKKTIDSDDES